MEKPPISRTSISMSKKWEAVHFVTNLYFSCADKEDHFMLKRPFRDYIVHFIDGIVLALGLLFLCAAFKN